MMPASLAAALVSAYVPSAGRHGYTVPDLSAARNNGTLTATGIGAFGASDATDYIAFRSSRGDKLSSRYNPHGPNAITSMSATWWMRPTAAVNAYNTILETESVNNGSNLWQFTVYLKSSRQLAFYCSASPSTFTNYDPGSTTLSLNTWYFIACVYRGGVRQQGYVNGVLDGTAPSVEASLAATSGQVNWGGTTWGNGVFGSRLLDADMDEMCRWNRDLTVAEIRWLYEQGRGNLFRRRPAMPYGLFAGGGVAGPVLFHSHYMSQGMRP